ncbi:hypothetical protein [Terriglobus roseus]|uniref:Uncharacterized protein n=1 Tax=Terriglobus roseus TaxID=392734 RepID=A0A1H4U6E7_9BACT|nr:hypothetical protein [Terriglobus roseus]SEC64289.1 hypothetical protein SAMN05443244_3974 [Terriglobus roseus]
MFKSTQLTNALLALIAVALIAIAIRPYLSPVPVVAQSGNADPIYVEPGVFMLRQPEGGQVLGKVTVNLRTGSVWGFPTGSPDPYPMSQMDSKPQVSHAIPMGRFALGEVGK